MKYIKHLIPLIFILLLSFWAIRPLLNAGFFPMHDDLQVERVFEMKKALTDGMFPVRWASDLGYGYGYPIFNFYAPLAYYVGGVINITGFSSLSATKIMMVIGIVVSGLGMYLFARKFWGDEGGLISGALYLYAPYHALDIYVRGDVAEFWAYAFIPLAFWGVYTTYERLNSHLSNNKNKSKKSLRFQVNLFNIEDSLWVWISLSAIFYAGIILSHNLTAMMVTPAIFIFSIILYVSHRLGDEIYKPYLILLGLLIGIALSAFYWLPVFPEINYTNVLSVVGGGSDYKDHFVCVKQLWSSPWGYGGSVPGCVDGLSFTIGKLHILLSALSIFAVVAVYKIDKTKFSILLFFVIGLLISIFLTLKESKFVWDSIPHMAFFQFPWRFLLMVSFYSSFLGGGIVFILRRFGRMVTVAGSIVVIFSVIFYNAKVFVPQKILDVKSENYTNKKILTWTASKISDEYMPKAFAKPLYPGAIYTNKIRENKTVKILSESEKTQIISAKVNAVANTDLFINLAYFPIWHVYIDSKQVYFKYSHEGIIIPIPKGKHKIEVRFSQTPVEKVGNAISIAGLMAIILGIITHKKNNVQKNT